jgi:demethylmenaquinone methyltransferase/2-methoxy-6-polyprenyl-1,4-benzoquinol methylase
MAELHGDQRARYVQDMFTRIAHRYDLMNRLMTAGQDRAWRREVIRRAALPLKGQLLDLGAGTGDLSEETLRQYPGSQAVAADFTLEMMQVGRERRRSAGLPTAVRPDWTAADALRLPFPAGVFDAVVSGFLMRNVTDVAQVLSEQYRALKPGGKIVVLDTTRPQPGLLSPLIDFHLHRVIPALGGLITGEPEAYRYLPNSTTVFLSAEQLAARMVAAGFRQVGFRRTMFGAIAIHWGVK